MAIMILAISLATNIILGLTVKIVWDGWQDDKKQALFTIKSLQKKCEMLREQVIEAEEKGFI